MNDAPTPKQENYSYSFKFNDKNYKIEFNLKENNLIISCIELNSFPPSNYSGEYSKNSLEKLSKFFLLFDNINDSIPEIISKFKKNEFSINKEDNILKITIKLNIMNCKDFAFNLNKKENNLNSIVESLCEIVNSLKNENQKLTIENNELKKEMDLLKKDIKEIKEKLLPLKERNRK